MATTERWLVVRAFGSHQPGDEIEMSAEEAERVQAEHPGVLIQMESPKPKPDNVGPIDRTVFKATRSG